MRKLQYVFVLSLILTSCMEKQSIDIQGHRGCRGLMPENTVPAFMHALGLGVTTLELDVVITRDKKVLVSHEPWISSEICVGGTEHPSPDDSLNIYTMTAEEVQRFDCGSKPHPRFPDQAKMAVYKPLLSEVFDVVETYLKDRGSKKVDYNIEIKSLPEGDGIFHPDPEEFAMLLLAEIEGRQLTERCVIQSFDMRSLEAVKAQQPDIRIAVLEEYNRNAMESVERISFTPEIYSPYFELLDQNAVELLHEKGIKVIPWTVNEPSDMQAVLQLEVDGIITDYPDRLNEVLKADNYSAASITPQATLGPAAPEG